MKKALTWADQAKLLQDRGLTIGDTEACVAFLTANNYYRVSGYLLPNAEQR